LKQKKHIIYKIEPGSIAEELELVPGDELVSINGTAIEDIFDYHYLTNDEQLVVLVRKPNGEEWELDIEKDYDEDLGIEFENGLMDDYKSCSNHCIFCFIDQMPPGMRDTLYFKDDDSRLSFLQGNYVTLTNMKDKDIERIIRYRLDPINISVHTTNPALRCEMLCNRFAGDALKKINTLAQAGIEMNGQIVCCKGINDGAELERTIRDLTRYIPHMQSLSVVPVGLTKYREGLYPLEPFGKEDAAEVIALIEKWQQYCMEHFGIHFVHASDEWYLTAGLPLPEEERYDGYIQLENGVGMLRLLFTEFHEALAEFRRTQNREQEFGWKEQQHGPGSKSRSAQPVDGKITIVSGQLAAPFIEQLAVEFMKESPGRHIDVAAIRNDFFGERITVAGLVTAQDLVAQLRGRDLGEYICIPCNMLRMGEQVFLDDWTVSDVEKALQVPVIIVKSSGQSLLDAMTGRIDTE
jgi:putative radical SAM enzyme (TIGR03279 family)